jgi:DNA-binding response OmpR family regulator/predicted ATPase
LYHTPGCGSDKTGLVRTSKSVAPEAVRPGPNRQLTLTQCVIDLDRGLVRPRSGSESSPQPLTTRECDLLRYLATRSPQPVSRDELHERVFGFSDATLSRACDNTIRRLREKIEVDASRPDHLLTVHGTGYRLALGDAEIEAVPAVVAAPVRVDLVLGDVTIDLGRQYAYGPQGEAALTTTEVRLLQRLMKANGEVVDRATLLREVWNQGSLRGRAVDNAVRRLRTKIEADPAEPTFLLTAVRGGYRLVLRQTPSGRPIGGKLPAPRDPFVGRDEELLSLRERLGPQASCRLVAVQGPVGSGKSRLALEALRGLESAWSGGVWRVDLGQARTAADIHAAVEGTLGISGGTDEQRLARVLGARGPTLVLLDNVDAVADHLEPLVESWLRSSPHPRVLLTGQVRLEFVPEPDRVLLGPLSVEQGVRLLALRGVKVDDDPQAAASIVAELDGLPLALELAAARGRLMPLQALVSWLGSRFRLLSGAGQDPRHQSLLAALDASFALLPREAREGMAQLSVFGGSFGVPAALAVLGLDEIEGLELLQALFDHSLLAHAEEPGRYALLASVRAYAERQQAPEARDQAQQRHAAFYARFGDRSFLQRCEQRDSQPVLAELKLEIPNLQAAASHALARGDRQTATDCTLALVRACRETPRTEQAARALLDKLLASPPVHREAEVTLSLVSLTVPWVEPERIVAMAARAAELAAPIGARQLGRAVRAQAIAFAQLGRMAEAIPLLHRALELATEAGDRFNQGAALSNLANVAGDPEEQIRLQTRALEVLQSCERRLTLSAQMNLGLHLLNDFRIEEARDQLIRARMGALGAGLGSMADAASINLGRLELIFGTTRACEAAYQQALASGRDHGDLEVQFWSQHGLSALRANQGLLEEAEAMLDAALDLVQGRSDSLGTSVWADTAHLRRQQGRLSEAMRCVERMEPHDPAQAALEGAWLQHLREPSIASALALGEAAERSRPFYPIPGWLAHAQVALFLAQQAEPVLARAALARAEADPHHRHVPRLSLLRLAARGELALLEGDTASALRAQGAILPLLEPLGVDPTRARGDLAPVLQLVERLAAHGREDQA